MQTLVIDIGGTNVKLWRAGESDKTKFPSGKELTPRKLLDGVRAHIGTWSYARVSIGYPGHVRHGLPHEDPYNLAPGWVDFDFATAFGCPIRIMNDACMQALGSYDGGRMLYLGLGTSFVITYIFDGKIVPLALGHLKFQRGQSFDDALSRRGLRMSGLKEWQRSVAEAATMLKAAFLADYIVLGGGNAKKLDELPVGCRRGGNHNAYFGGLRMWEDHNPLIDTLPLTVFPQQPEVAT